MRNQKGFTLVEIAIVLVIIGLILGGIIRGQAMIENARAKKLENDIASFRAAYFTHLDKERSVPGDDADPPTGQVDPAKAWEALKKARIIPGDDTNNDGPRSPFGTEYTWFHDDDGTLAGTPAMGNGIQIDSIPLRIAEMLDEKLDDGDHETGDIRSDDDYDSGEATTTMYFAIE